MPVIRRRGWEIPEVLRPRSLFCRPEAFWLATGATCAGAAAMSVWLRGGTGPAHVGLALDQPPALPAKAQTRNYVPQNGDRW